MNREKLLKEEDEDDENNSINCPCLIGLTFTSIICICVFWLIIQYN